MRKRVRECKENRKRMHLHTHLCMFIQWIDFNSIRKHIWNVAFCLCHRFAWRNLSVARFSSFLVICLKCVFVILNNGEMKNEHLTSQICGYVFVSYLFCNSSVQCVCFMSSQRNEFSNLCLKMSCLKFHCVHWHASVSDMKILYFKI